MDYSKFKNVRNPISTNFFCVPFHTGVHLRIPLMDGWSMVWGGGGVVKKISPDWTGNVSNSSPTGYQNNILGSTGDGF